MSDAGVLPQDVRTELIEGVVGAMPAIGEDHLWNVNSVNQVFFRHFDRRAMISIQNPVVIAPNSEPPPNIVLLRAPSEGKRRKPVPADVYLLVEVSDTTLTQDRKVKVPLYAAAGILETWLINLDVSDLLQ